MLTSPGVTTLPPRSMRSPLSGSAPAPTSRTKPSSTRSQPPACSRPRVVERHDVRVGVEGAHTSSGTSSNAVDVDEAAVRDLQARDHRERQEGEQLERRGSVQPSTRAASTRGSPRPPRRAAGRRAGRQREGQLRADLAVGDDDDPASELREPLDRELQVVVVHPDATMLCASCAIVDASAARREAEPTDEAEADPAGAEVALDDGDLREVVRRPRRRGRRESSAPRRAPR